MSTIDDLISLECDINLNRLSSLITLFPFLCLTISNEIIMHISIIVCVENIFLFQLWKVFFNKTNCLVVGKNHVTLTIKYF